MTSRMLDKATVLARHNSVKGLPRMAAILITEDGKFFHGFNSRKTHPLAKKFGRHSKTICLHAEVDAIRRCLGNGGRTHNANLFVARVGKDNHPRLAKPCEGCERAIVQFGIKEVEWTE